MNVIEETIEATLIICTPEELMGVKPRRGPTRLLTKSDGHAMRMPPVSTTTCEPFTAI